MQFFSIAFIISPANYSLNWQQLIDLYLNNPYLLFQASPTLLAARPVARPQVAMAVVAAAATEEQTQVAAIMRYQRGSPMKVTILQNFQRSVC